VVNNKNNFKSNFDVCNTNTRQKYKFHQPSSNLSIYQKGVYLVGINVFSSLPQSINNLRDNPKEVKSALKKYLYAHSYSVDQYFNVDNDKLSLINFTVTSFVVCM